MKKMRWMMVGIFAAMSLGAMSQPVVPALPFDPEVTKGTLPNGLTYYIQHNENPQKRAYFYIAQKVGSVQEEESQRGLAHFLEHMCFNGSDHFPGKGIINFCEKIGVQFGRHLNAYTSTDRTVYNIDNVPVDDEKNLDSCLYILYDWAHGLTLDPKEVDNERGVIHEEWRVRSNGIMRILERQLPVLAKGSRYADRLPIGLMSVVDSFAYKELRDYYDKWYRPDLQGIIVVGDFDVKVMEEKVKKIFSSLPAPKADAAPLEYFTIPDNEQPIIVFDKDKEVTAPMVMMGSKYDPVPRAQRNTMMGVVSQYMENIISSMFNRRLSELMQTPDIPFASVEGGVDGMIITDRKKTLGLNYSPKQGKDKEALTVALREMRRLGVYGFSEAEFSLAKTELEGQLDQQLASRKTVKSKVLVNECVEHFLENDVKTSFTQEIAMHRTFMKRIPLEAINEMVKEAIGQLDTNLVIAGFYPDKEEFVMPSSTEAQEILAQVKKESLQPYEMKEVDTRILDKQPQAGTIIQELAEDPFGYKGFVLSNGVTVKYKKTDFDESKIICNAVSHGGLKKVALEDVENARFFNQFIANNGLGKYTGNELEKALAGRVIHITPQLKYSTEQIVGNTSKKDAATMFQLMHLYFTDLKYDTLNYNIVRKSMMDQLANRNARPTTAFEDSTQILLNCNHPLAQPFTVERLKKVTYDGVYALYKKRFANAADFTFIFTGAIEEDSIKQWASLYLGSIPTHSRLLEKYEKKTIPMMKGSKTCRFTQKMETPQSYMATIWNGKTKWTTQTEVMAAVLKKILSIYSTETIREKYQFTYGSYTDMECGELMGEERYLLQMLAPVKPGKCDSALAILKEGVAMIAEKGVSEEQLNKVKEQELKVFETNQRENGYWNRLEQGYVLYNNLRPLEMKKVLEDLTSEQIRNFVKKVVYKNKNVLDVIMEPEQ